MNKRVVITGLGVVSSIGIGWKEFWENLLQGTSGISPVSSFDTADHFTHNGGEVKSFVPEDFIDKERVKLLNRSSHMALAATKLAFADSGIETDYLKRKTVGVSFGTTLGDAQTIEDINTMLVHKKSVDRRSVSKIPTHAAPCNTARQYGINGPVLIFTTACAAGNYGIAYGYDLIRLHRADIVIAGASDPFSRIEFTGFNQLRAVAPEKCQPFDKNRKGMMVAEGAGMLILESLESALQRNAEIYAEISGYGLSCDAQHMTQPSVDGVARCMMNALKGADISEKDVDYICAHGTGTRANDRTECAAIKQVFKDRHSSIPVSSVKSMIGHTMGAASAIEGVTCALVVKNDIIPPTINYETPDPECDIDCVPNKAREHVVNIALNNSYAFGGNNAALVVRKYA
ncbi:MAG: beta-ketoacyl-[acyl-carrier-protein] synthase family protein [Nitrospirota bacterium]